MWRLDWEETQTLIERQQYFVPIADGVVQAREYARQCGADEVHLVIFNRDPAIGWDEKIWHQVRADASRMRVDVWGA